MSDIDWSKAPSDAQAGARGGYRGWSNAWYKQEEGQWFCLLMDIPHDKWSVNDGPCGRADLELRPVAGWNGEGLPPIGTACEIFDDDPHEHYAHQIGRQVVIIAHRAGQTGPVAVCEVPGRICDQDQSAKYFGLVANCFRPIKTPEQIEREEFIEMVSALLGWNSCLDGSRRDAGLLFDSGYRKPKPE